MTLKQQKFVKKILENLGNNGEVDNLCQIAKEAGYSDSMAKNPKEIIETNGVQEKLEPVLKSLKQARRRAIDKLEGKEEKATYRGLIKGIETFSKQIDRLQRSGNKEKKRDLSEIAKERLSNYIDN
jgi:hypothetical protein